MILWYMIKISRKNPITYILTLMTNWEEVLRMKGCLKRKTTCFSNSTNSPFVIIELALYRQLSEGNDWEYSHLSAQPQFLCGYNHCEAQGPKTSATQRQWPWAPVPWSLCQRLTHLPHIPWPCTSGAWSQRSSTCWQRKGFLQKSGYPVPQRPAGSGFGGWGSAY